MKSILLSIQPKWCEKIAQKIKTVEVRKTRPKLETPFKCYIYCTKNKLLTKSHFDNSIYIASTNKYRKILEKKGNITLNGKVIGEFVCDEIEHIGAYLDEDNICNITNLFMFNIKRFGFDYINDLFDYIVGKNCKVGKKYKAYGWHISDLKIYDKPRELSEFKKLCSTNHEYDNKCYNCPNLKLYDNIGEEGGYQDVCISRLKSLTRPPMSWCYIEEKE